LISAERGVEAGAERAIYDFKDSDSIRAAELTEKAVYGLTN